MTNRNAGFRLFRSAARLTLLLVLFAGCRTGRERMLNAEKPRDAVDYAVAFARLQDPGDEAASWDTGRVLADLSLICIERDELRRAASVAAEIRSWHRGCAQADVAAALAFSGHLREARPLMAQAEALAAELRSRHAEGTMGWTSERILGHLTLARTAMGDAAGMDTNAAALDPNVSVELLRKQVAAAPAQDIPAFAWALEAKARANPVPLLPGFMDGLLDWLALRPSPTAGDVRAVYDVVTNALPRQTLVNRVAVMGRLAGLAGANGLPEAGAWPARAAALARLAPAGYQRAISLALAAEGAAGTNAVLSLLDEACATGREEVGVDARIIALCRVAESASRRGLTERAAALHGEALALAAGQPIARPRLTLLIQVCVSRARCREEMPPALADALASRLRGEQVATGRAGMHAGQDGGRP